MWSFPTRIVTLQELQVDAWCIVIFCSASLHFCLLGFTLGTFWRPVFFPLIKTTFPSHLSSDDFGGTLTAMGSIEVLVPLPHHWNHGGSPLGGSSHDSYVVKWWGNHPPIYKPPKFRPFGREHNPMELGDLSPGFIQRLPTGVTSPSMTCFREGISFLVGWST